MTTEKPDAVRDLGRIMYTLGEIAATVWPNADIPAGIQATLLSRPYDGLRLMREHDAYKNVPVDRLITFLDRVSSDFTIPVGGLSEEHTGQFWAGFIGD